MRKELRRRGIKKLKVVYSKEPPLQPVEKAAEGARRQIPASIAFVPATAGMILAGAVIKDLAGL
jgi:tRNA A37 threonylcarbamoyladenosine dehydratase